jgi:hypothetical protein
MMDSIPVSVDNFVRAESDRMLADLMAAAGGINRWRHHREPADVDDQVVVRLNRDTLYSFAVVDLAEGATLTVPDAGERYLSVMVVSQDHHIPRIFHDAGQYDLDMSAVGSRYALIAARVLVDPADPADVAEVATLQDAFDLQAPSAEPFVMPPYAEASFDGVRSALKDLARYATDASGTFGARGEVDPVHHLIGTAAGWGGLPEREAVYLMVEPRLPVGEYRLTVGEVPVDGFWSISVYNADGFFEKNERDAYSVNSVTADRNPDGTVTVHLGGCDGERPNCLPIMDGWNYTVRLYRPQPEILEGLWSFPTVEVVDPA